MIRTLIFGAIAGYVGKKFYDEGKLTEFKNDLVSRYNQAKSNLDTRREANRPIPGTASPSPHAPGASGSL